MAKKKIENNTAPVINKIVVSNFTMSSLELSKWKSAILSARNVLNPRRRDLYELYLNVMLDAHLTSVADKRRRGVTNKRVTWIADNGDPIPDSIQKGILDTPWFYDLRCYAMESIMWGHSLIELQPGEDFPVGAAELLNRINVQPEYGRLLYNYYNYSQYLEYRTDPSYKNFMIEVGKKDSFGLLMQAAFWVIIKRGGVGDWAQLAEIFGMPFRVAYYNPHDNENRTLTEQGMEAMGAAGYAILPDGARIEFPNQISSGNITVHKDLVNICDEQLSKLVLGQTMTTSEGGSYAQGYVHKSVEEEINQEDIIMMEYLLNWDVKKKLAAIGYPEVMNGHFKIDVNVQLDLKTMVDIVMKLSTKIPIEKKYLYETFGIPTPDPNTPEEDLVSPQAPVAPAPAESPLPGKEAEDEPAIEKKKANVNRIAAFYRGIKPIAAAMPEVDAIWNAIIEAMHAGKLKPGKLDKSLLNFLSNHLAGAVQAGMGSSRYLKDTYKDVSKALQENVHVFSAFKTAAALKDASALLTDDKGNLRPFNDFKADMLQLNDLYNKAWLETEYNFAVATSQQAANWSDYTRDAEVFPNLTFNTVGDERVREEHAALDKITKPVDDEFWDTYYPPIGWGCRCDVMQSDGPVTEVKDAAFPTVPDMFKTNWGKEQIAFPDQHPYYNVSRAEAKSIKKQI